MKRSPWLICALTFALVRHVTVAADNVAIKAVPQAELDSSMQEFLRSGKGVSGANFESKLMAQRFARYQALPLAWFDFAENAYCIRLLHVHSLSSAPNDRGVVIELRGYKGLGAILLAEVDQVGVRWTAKTISAEIADKILAMTHEGNLFAMATKDKPTYTGPYGFSLEVRHGRNYNFIYRDAPSERAESRGVGGFLAVIKKLIEIAGIADSEIFYGAAQKGAGR